MKGMLYVEMDEWFYEICFANILCSTEITESEKKVFCETNVDEC